MYFVVENWNFFADVANCCGTAQQLI